MKIHKPEFTKPKCSHMNLILVQNFPNLPLFFFVPIQPYWGGGWWAGAQSNLCS